MKTLKRSSRSVAARRHSGGTLLLTLCYATIHFTTYKFCLLYSHTLDSNLSAIVVQDVPRYISTIFSFFFILLCNLI